MKKIIILASILLLAAACQKGGNSGTQASTQNQNTQNAQNSPSGWNTYQNAKWGFEIKYPETFSLTEENSNTPNSYIPLCGEQSKACLLLKKESGSKTNLQAAAVAIKEISAGTKASCKMSRQNEITNGEVTVNGVKYASSFIDDAAMGHWAKQRIYRVWENNFCVQIGLGIAGFNRENLADPTTFTEVNQESIWKQLEEIFSTASFK